jgi:hypothetical protein
MWRILSLKLHVDDIPLICQQGIQERDQHGLGNLLSEDSLESYVSEWVYELAHFLWFNYTVQIYDKSLKPPNNSGKNAACPLYDSGGGSRHVLCVALPPLPTFFRLL